ncbi:hypothetical protein [Sphingomonas quercus]|uniref:Uncharacterized protein n=1 Tax=Sphingomonas quercus TaxID=2842451 RepID=A0ABS6BFP0_9SPHN|nr:hypothetical protein [Sphingomonas quercus]MBU3077014.1 hypothetical protein [Sphingomonas quercus]
MAVLPPISSPANAWRDLKEFFRTRERSQLLFGMLALVMPALIVTGFYIDSDPGPQAPVTVYVQNYNGDRPDSVIIAQQKIDKVVKDRELAEKRAAYQRLAKQLGMD